MNDPQIVILAGGKGSRLGKLTNNLPKPMVTMHGKPFLEILIQMLNKKGFSRFLLLVGHLSNRIISYFGDGSQFGYQIKYSIEKEYLGTGGGLKNAKNVLENEFLLINGDTFLDIDYNDFIKFSKIQNTICSMVCYNGEPFNNVKYNLKLNSKCLIENYSKEIFKPEFNAIDAGAYFIKKEILSITDKKSFSLENDVFPFLISKKQIAGFATKKRFFDIGTLKSLNNFKFTFN